MSSEHRATFEWQKQIRRLVLDWWLHCLTHIGLMIQIKTDRTDNWPCWASLGAFIIHPMLIYGARTDRKWLMAWCDCDKDDSQQPMVITLFLLWKAYGLMLCLNFRLRACQASKAKVKINHRNKESLRRSGRWRSWNWWSMIEAASAEAGARCRSLFLVESRSISSRYYLR